MKTILFNREEIYKGNLILVNRDCEYHRQPSDLSAVPSAGAAEILLDHRACAKLNELMAGIAGWEHIVAVSGWRSLEEQEKIWDDSLRENGPEFTEKYVVVPMKKIHMSFKLAEGKF